MIMFSDRDANILITTFLQKNDIISLIKTNKRLRGELYYLPYKKFKFDWCSDNDTLKTFVNYSPRIEELIVSRYEFFFLLMVKLPNLKKITLEQCELDDLKLLELYSSSLREITINRCLIECTDIETKNYPKLQKVILDPDRVDTKRRKITKTENNTIIVLDKKPIDCCVIEVF